MKTLFKLNMSPGEEYIEDIDIYLNYIVDNADVIDDSGYEDVFVDTSKKTVLIIDDNEGICSFLRDDFMEILGDRYKDYNILTFSTPMAAYIAIKFLERNNITVDYAIIDILLNGILKTDVKNLRLNGVDFFSYLLKKYKIQNYIFYTGNQLQGGVKLIDKIKKSFHDLTGKELEDYTMFKTAISIEERQDILKNKLLGL